MKFLKELKQLNRKDVLLAGGKGASFGEMTLMGIQVPSGFVILSTAFEKFLKETSLDSKINIILNSVDYSNIENISKKIRALIFEAKIPKDIIDEIKISFKELNTKYIAVRSSATIEDSPIATCAGQLESYLNITEENLIEKVNECWASLFSIRAMLYCLEKNIDSKKISIAVIVQKMVNSEKSGVAFSVHPITQDKNQLIIEAGLGLGEAIVSGKIMPDDYVIEKESKKIISKNLSKKTQEKQILSDKEILELSDIIINIENHFGFPCDIEWAFEHGSFYFLQVRPITTF